MPSADTRIYDALVLGAGPAGLSAALALSRVHRTAAVFSSKEFRNANTHVAHTILTRDGVDPIVLRDLGRKEIEGYGYVDFVEKRIVHAKTVEEEGSANATLFEVEDSDGSAWKGRKIVLAMGSRDIFPSDIKGYAKNRGRNIYQCLFCDGHERSHMPAGVLTFPSPFYLHYVLTMMSLSVPSITIFTNGSVNRSDKAVADALAVANAKGVTLDERKIAQLDDAGDKGVDIVFEDGSRARAAFLVHKPPTGVVAADLVRELGVDIIEGTDSLVKRNDPFGETNVKGVFVAGDAGTLLKQVMGGMAQGATAGAGIHNQRCQQEIERVMADLKSVEVEDVKAKGLEKEPGALLK
ncbi:hypothetical protein B0A49_12794 [Cryomyces minteri]|uniref:FAD/NAD(P)-binding domain-containing protein n=1 Tax=Cryomyces minteri TaxID=331657 RepID=A0A4U0W5M1_9PEZI|nr:hypothetical protein B0A49_12794 [Cryomyces minteri]